MNGYRQHTEVLGGINCLVLRPENGTPERAAVLCHGFGDQGLDLANCLRDDALAEMALDHRVVFVFPDSPFRVVQTPGWWTPDFSHLVDGNPRCLRDDCPDELPPSRQRIVAVIDDLMAQSGLPAARFVVGGFSQGAVLATDVALSMSDAPAALCV